MSQCSVRPYEGSEDYIFVSFCRSDAAQAFSVIERMAADGCRLWFDRDADPVSADIEEVALRLNGAAAAVFLLSEDALNSFGCRRELNFALMKNKRIIAVMLSPAHLSLGMEMQLSSAAFLSKYEYDSEPAFFAALYEQKGLASCKSDVSQADAAYDTLDSFGAGAAFTGESEEELPTQEFSMQSYEEELQRKEEEERLRTEELERFRREEEERQRKEEEERLRREEEERLRREEEERLRREEEERLRREEEERLRREEEERLRREEEERLRREEEERIRREEEERIRREEEEERIRLEEEERQRKAQLAEQERIAFLAQEAEAERVRKFEAERQRQAQQQAPQFIFCSFCGKKLPAATKFCTGCGSLLTKDQPKAEMLFGSAAQMQRAAVAAPPIQNAPAQPMWQLRRMSTGETVGIPLGSFTVGRSETDANYVIKGNNAIGRKHAVFGCSANGVTVTDLHSMNQTRINGQELLPEVTYQLADGDVVQFANEQFLLTRFRG